MSDKQKAYTRLVSHILACRKCAISAGTWPIPGKGNLDATLMLIGMEPGDKEEKEGEPFVGATGRYLRQCFEHLDYPWKDIYRTNMVRCRPRDGIKGRNANDEEHLACAPWVIEEVKLVDPDVIILMGTGTVDLAWPGAQVTSVNAQVRAVEFAGRVRVFVGSIHGAAVLRQRKWAPLLMKALRTAVEIARTAEQIGEEHE